MPQEFPQHRRWARLLEKPEGHLQNGVLRCRIVRLVQRITMAKGNDQRARSPDPLGDVAEQLQNDRGNALTFQFGSDQAHGLVTHRSHWHQQSNVSMIGQERPGYLRR